jgi:hypothetical protein
MLSTLYDTWSYSFLTSARIALSIIRGDRLGRTSTIKLRMSGVNGNAEASSTPQLRVRLSNGLREGLAVMFRVVTRHG